MVNAVQSSAAPASSSAPVQLPITLPGPVESPPSPLKPVKKSLFSRIPKRFLIGGLVLVLLVTGGAAGFLLTQNNTDIRQQASGGDNPYETCSFPGQCLNGKLCEHSGGPPSNNSCSGAPTVTGCEGGAKEGDRECVGTGAVKVCVSGEWQTQNCAAGKKCDSATKACLSPSPSPSPSPVVCHAPGECLDGKLCAHAGEPPTANSCSEGLPSTTCPDGSAEGTRKCSIDHQAVETCVNGQWQSVDCKDNWTCSSSDNACHAPAAEPTTTQPTDLPECDESLCYYYLAT